MSGRIDLFIPRTADGELMTGEVPKGMRKRATFTKSIDVRTFFDPLADHNLPGAIPAPKARPFNPHVAPRGWRLATPIADEPTSPTTELEEVPNALRTMPKPARRRHPVRAVREPQASVRTAPQADQGRACPSCGRSGFRRSGAGLKWHVERCRKVAA